MKQRQPWGRIISFNEDVIKSEALSSSQVQIQYMGDNEQLITPCQISLDVQERTVTLKSTSEEPTYLGNEKIGKDNEVTLKTGDKIYFNLKEDVGFRLDFNLKHVSNSVGDCFEVIKSCQNSSEKKKSKPQVPQVIEKRITRQRWRQKQIDSPNKENVSTENNPQFNNHESDVKSISSQNSSSSESSFSVAKSSQYSSENEELHFRKQKKPTTKRAKRNLIKDIENSHKYMNYIADVFSFE